MSDKELPISRRERIKLKEMEKLTRMKMFKMDANGTISALPTSIDPLLVDKRLTSLTEKDKFYQKLHKK